MATPQSSLRTSADLEVYDKHALKDEDWEKSWGPQVPRDPSKPDGEKRSLNGIRWTPRGKERAIALPAQVAESQKILSEIVASWLSEMEGKIVSITAPGHDTTGYKVGSLVQDGEHVTLGYTETNVHAYVIYPKGVSLGSSHADMEQRHRSRFVVANAHIGKRKDAKRLSDRGPLGIEILTYFEQKGFKVDDPRCIMVYDQARQVSVICVDKPNEIEHTFQNLVDLPRARLGGATADLTPSSTRPSVIASSAPSSGVNTAASTAGPTVTLGPQSTQKTRNTTGGSRAPAADSNRTSGSQVTTQATKTTGARKVPATRSATTSGSHKTTQPTKATSRIQSPAPSSATTSGSYSTTQPTKPTAERQIPGASSATTSRSQQSQATKPTSGKQITAAAGKSTNKPSSAQASTSAAPKNAAQPNRGAAGSIGVPQLPLQKKRPSNAKESPVQLGNEWFWVDKDAKKLARYAPP